MTSTPIGARSILNKRNANNEDINCTREMISSYLANEVKSKLIKEFFIRHVFIIVMRKHVTRKKEFNLRM